jgi:hypothetical protein
MSLGNEQIIRKTYQIAEAKDVDGWVTALPMTALSPMIGESGSTVAMPSAIACFTVILRPLTRPTATASRLDKHLTGRTQKFGHVG